MSPGSASAFQLDRASVVASRRGRPRAKGIATHAANGRHVVNENIFRSVLVRERKRADRSGSPFMLLLVGIQGDDSAASRRHALAALVAAKRETDVAGWFDQGRTAGLILTETGLCAATARRAVEDRVRSELSKRLEPASMARVAIGLHVHPMPANAESLGTEHPDPLPAPFRSRQLRRVTAAFKRSLDIVGSSAALFAMAPVLFVISALVKLTSPGPVFFRQVRVGQDAQPFTMLKFRTMHANVDQALHREYVSWFITASDKSRNAGHDGLFKMAHDPRITPVGRILRKTSLDELPQFINVLLGEMSLVGPRPPLPYELEQYKAWHRRRVVDAKPGITGLWQVTGRSRTTFDEMVRLDLRYARTPTLWGDIKILLATPRAVVSGKGAC